MKPEILEVNGNKYLMKIHFENRKSCRVSIRKKTINIRIPSFLQKKETGNELS